MKAFGTLFKNEWRLNVRNMNMVIFAVIMPLVVLMILGLIYGTKPAADGASYTFMEQSFGALCSISICAGGLMGLPLVISEYRERKVLKRFQVTPVSPIMLLAVEFAIYILYCAVSLISLLPAAALFWKVTMHGSWLPFLGSWLLTMISTLSIGMLVGGVAKNTKTASLLACILYFPMLLFSGATLPSDVLPQVIREIAGFFPLTQGVQLMKASFLGLPPEAPGPALLIMGLTAALSTAASVKWFKWE